MTKAKKKLIAIIATLVVVAVAGVGLALGLISNKPDTAKIRARFASSSVSATISASYELADGSDAVLFLNTDGKEGVTFTEEDGVIEKSLLSTQSFKLTESVPYALITFSIRNNQTVSSSREGKGLRVSLTDTSRKNGVVAKYRVVGGVDDSLINRYEQMASAPTTEPRAIYVGPQTTVYYQILVERSEGEGEYLSDEEQGLLWSLDKADAFEENGFLINKNNVVTAYNGSDTEITIPSSAVAVDSNVFNTNTSLTSVTIPSTIKRIGANAFSGCTSLTSVTFESQNSTQSQYRRVFTQEQISMGDETETVIEAGAFNNCTSLTEVILPSDLKVVNGAVFSGCSAIQSISIPEGVTEICKNAFNGCEALSEVTLPNTLETIGEDSFKGCISLESITLPEIISTISGNIFTDCDNLEEVIMNHAGIEYVFDGDFVTITLPSVVINEIPANAFKGITALKSIVIPSNVTIIGESAFEGCTGLESVVVKGDILEINDKTFKGCSSLKIINYPSLNNLDYIGEEAFASSGIESFEFQNEEVEIGTGAFSNCLSLKSIVVEALEDESYNAQELVLNVSKEVFTGCTALDRIKINIYFGSRPVDAGYYVFSGGFEGINLGYSNSDFANPSMPGCETIIEAMIPTATWYTDYELNADAFKNCVNLEKVILPYKITTVGASAFNGCTSLKSVTLSAWTDNIQTHAFYSCTALEEIHFPSTLVAIKSYAFGVDVSLTEINLPASLRVIEEGAFDSCSSLERVDFNDDTDGLETLGDYAFNNCVVLEYVELPGNIGTGSTHAFDGCTELKTIKLIGVGVIGSDGSTQEPGEGSSQTDDTNTPINTIIWDIPNLENVIIGKNIQCLGVRVLTAIEEGEDGFIYHFNNLKTLTFEEGSLCEAILTGGLAGLPITSLDLRNATNFSYLDSCVFEGSKVRMLILPESVEEINFEAFDYASALLEIYNLSNVEITPNNSLNPLAEFFILSVHTSLDEESIYTTTDDDIVEAEIGGEKIFVSYLGEAINYSIPDGYTAIGSFAFLNTNVRNLIIPDSIKNIMPLAFENSNITSVLFESETTWYGQDNINSTSDNGAENLSSFRYGGTKVILSGEFVLNTNNVIVDYIGEETELVLPQVAVGVGAGALAGLSSIKSITIPSSIERIEEGAFRNNNIETIIFDDNSKLKYIGKHAFETWDYFGAPELVIPASVEVIDDYAFYAKALTSLSFENGSQLKTIGAHAFEMIYMQHGGAGQPNFESTTIDLPSGLETIGDNAFYFSCNTSDVTFNIPASVIKIGTNAFDVDQNSFTISFAQRGIWIHNGEMLDSDAVAENIENGDEGEYIKLSLQEDFYVDSEGVLWVYSGEGGEVVIPSGVTVISQEVFAYYGEESQPQITKVTIPASVEYIYEYAFAKQPIREVVFMPNSKLKRICLVLFVIHKLRV